MLEAALLFHTARVLLLLFPFRRLRFLLGSLGRSDQPAAPVVTRTVGPEVLGVARALRWAARGHPSTCLAQALAGRSMLRRRGLPSSITFGVREDNGRLCFHAWLRCQGVILNPGGGARHYRVLGTYHDSAPTPT